MVEGGKKTIVVVGGTGGVGRHIVGGIAATKKYIVKVFTRQGSSSSSELTTEGVEVIAVDYSDHASLVKELQGVHTVICITSLDESAVQSQLNLLAACLEAKVKRFAPFEWAGVHETDSVVQWYRQMKVPALEKVRTSCIEHTFFTTGIFMEYIASPQKASPSLPALTLGVDFNQCQANFIGAGDEPFCLTSAADVGRFVAAALELDKWEGRLGMVGSRTTWNELTRLGGKVRGEKFVVNRTTVDEAMSKRESKQEDEFGAFLQEVYIGICRGEFDYEATLNKKFPQIAPTTVEAFVEKWWGGKEGQTF